MTDQEMWKLFVLLRRPIPWDPVPIWWKLTDDQMAKFTEIQTKFNTQMAQIESRKLNELQKLSGMGR